MSYASTTKGCKINIYFKNTRVTAETLNTTGDDHVFTFDHAPVSTKNLRLVGTFGGVNEFIVNYDLEPISGKLTVAAALPAYTAIVADYFYYANIEDGIDILVQDYRVSFPKPVADIDIWGQPHYQIHNNYPHVVRFKVVLSNEAQRNLLTEATFHAAYFLLLDKNIGETYGLRAYEGPLWSDEQGSIRKGASFLLPIELFVQQFGNIDLGGSGIIVSTQNPGGGKVRCTSASHGLVTGDVVTITGTIDYNGTFTVTKIDNNVFEITDTWVSDQRGRWSQKDSIKFGFWEN